MFFFVFKNKYLGNFKPDLFLCVCIFSTKLLNRKFSYRRIVEQ